MTQEERTILINKMLSTPDMLTAEDIDAAIHDAELRAMYDTAVLLRSASMPVREYDIDSEWQLFNRRGKAVRLGMPLPKWAAAVVIMLSLGAVAATVTFTYKAVESRKAAPEALTTAPQASVSAGEVVQSVTEDICLAEEITFENVRLADIAKQVGEAFACKVAIADSDLGSLRLYMVLPKGCTAAYFVQLLDAYDMLDAAQHEGVITIKRSKR